MKKKQFKAPDRPVIYEVSLTISSAREKELVKWLKTHIQEMLNVAGFMRASLLHNQAEKLDANDSTQDTDDSASSSASQELPFKCTVRYHVESEEHLNQYFATQADAMRAKGPAKFGSALTATRHVYLVDSEQRSTSLSKTETKSAFKNVNDVYCMNCESLLRGDYCHSCGQKYQRKVVPIFDVVSEYVSGVFEWDSRLWQTMTPLLVKPGHLTKTFLEGKRQRYIPPIRLYFITSVVFFLAATIQPKSMLKEIDVDKPLFSDSLEFNFGESDKEGGEITASDQAANNIASLANTDENLPNAQAPPPAAMPTATENSQAASAEFEPEDDEEQLTIKKLPAEYCEDILDVNEGIKNEFFRDRFYRACQSLTTWRGVRDFALEMLENLPLTLIVLLPFMAFVHKILYLFSHRYYVEHLLFYVHNYSFLFAFSTLMLGLTALLHWQSYDASWVFGLSTLYVIYYFLRSMRVVYGKSRTVTFIIWLLANFSFISVASLVLTATAALTATQMAQ